MKSLVAKRSIVIAGHKTSVSLEEPFWRRLKDIAAEQHMTLSSMVGKIDIDRTQGNLSSSLRLFVLEHSFAHPSEGSVARIVPTKSNGGRPPNNE
jgi:predicted DNA-binding ribbon-helix-helix protein